MKGLKIVEQLNNLVNANASEPFVKGNKVTFYSGDGYSKVAFVASSIAPQSKVVVLYTRDGIMNSSIRLTNVLKSAGLKPYNVVIDDVGDVVRCAGGILRAPEDCRIIIVTDYSLYKLALYTASVGRLPLIYLMENVKVDGLLSPLITIKNGNITETVSVSVNRHLILSSEKILAKPSISNAYLDVESKIIALIDYRINALVNGISIDQKAYDLARESISAVYGMIRLKKKVWTEFVLYNAFALEIANLLSGGKIYSLSSIEIAMSLASDTSIKLDLFCRLMGLYHLCFSGKADCLYESANYLARSEELQSILGGNQTEYMKGLSFQLEKLKASSASIEDIKDRFSEEVKGHNKNVAIIKDTYFAISDTETVKKKKQDNAKAPSTNSQDKLEIIKKAIKYCGDMGNLINGASICREQGLLEII